MISTTQEQHLRAYVSNTLEFILRTQEQQEDLSAAFQRLSKHFSAVSAIPSIFDPS